MAKTQKKSDDKNSRIEKVLLENFVEMQKVMVDLSVKIGDLSSKVSRLLDLFENTAKSMSVKGMGEENKEVIRKIDSVIEQNKTIAKGLSMMYDAGEEEEKPVQRTYPSPTQKPQNFSSDRFRQPQR